MADGNLSDAYLELGLGLSSAIANKLSGIQYYSGWVGGLVGRWAVGRVVGWAASRHRKIGNKTIRQLRQTEPSLAGVMAELGN